MINEGQLLPHLSSQWISGALDGYQNKQLMVKPINRAEPLVDQITD